MPHHSETGLARLTAIEVPVRSATGPRAAAVRAAVPGVPRLTSRSTATSSSAVDNSTVEAEITATFRDPSLLQSYSSICDLVCDLVRSAGLNGVEVATRPMHPYPPWLLKRAHTEVDTEGLRKDQNPLSNAWKKIITNSIWIFSWCVCDGRWCSWSCLCDPRVP